MHWLDIVLLIVLGIGVLVGWRIGLLGAFFNAAGLILGVFFAGRFSDDIADMLTESVSSDTLATVIGYAMIMIGMFAAAQVARSIVKRILSLVFLGWVDSVGGLALGLVAGTVLSGALILMIARYSADIPAEGAVGIVLDQINIRQSVDDALTGSTLVPIYLDITDAIPADAIGFVPDDFRIALELLEQRIDAANAQTP